MIFLSLHYYLINIVKKSKFEFLLPLFNSHPYLAKVPCACTDLFLCAVVNPPDVVQNVLLPLLLIIQEHRVLWKDMNRIISIHFILIILRIED